MRVLLQINSFCSVTPRNLPLIMLQMYILCRKVLVSWWTITHFDHQLVTEVYPYDAGANILIFYTGVSEFKPLSTSIYSFMCGCAASLPLLQIISLWTRCIFSRYFINKLQRRSEGKLLVRKSKFWCGSGGFLRVRVILLQIHSVTSRKCFTSTFYVDMF